METFIVIPCLNEAGCIEATCKSLSFGDGAEPCGRLVLVDNGSSDATLQVLAGIQRASPPGRVLVTRELQRGYVSARRAGMAAILAQAQHEQLRDDLVLVLQADADTIYLPGYVSTMQDAHSGVRGQLLEGSAVTSRDFNLELPAFAKLCREVDSEMEHWFASEKDQVIVDDKVCAFLLADYLAWGEHQDDLDDRGIPVFAETTRLFLRAKRCATVSRCRVEAALALPSRRRLRTQAPGYFACSGFPRQSEWMNAWGAQDESESFLRSPDRWPGLSRLVRSRQRHQLALFALLPAVVEKLTSVSQGLAALADTVRTSSVATSPGLLLSLMLKLADDEHGPLAALLQQGPPHACG